MTGLPQPPAVPAGWYPDPPKSAVAAGLLRLFFGWSGLDRFYSAPSASRSPSSPSVCWGILLWFVLLGWVIQIPLTLWTFIDAIMMFTGSVEDTDGRNLR
jgi:TM2 domain-containing membrane protein YozV